MFVVLFPNGCFKLRQIYDWLLVVKCKVFHGILSLFSCTSGSTLYISVGGIQIIIERQGPNKVIVSFESKRSQQHPHFRIIKVWHVPQNLPFIYFWNVWWGTWNSFSNDFKIYADTVIDKLKIGWNSKNKLKFNFFLQIFVLNSIFFFFYFFLKFWFFS